MKQRYSMKPIIGLVGLLIPFVGIAADEAEFSFSGSFQSLGTVSETPVSREDYWSDLNRLRLDFGARFNSFVAATAVIDNEFLIGSIIDTDDFQLVKDSDLDSNTRWDWDNLVVDNEDLVWRASVYRAFLKFTSEDLNVVAGRQRIAWGTGRLWNPTDVFNPVSPLQIDKSQRDGIDGLSAEYFIGNLSSIELVYALGQESELDSLGARFGTNVGGYDFGLLVGDIRESELVGVDFGGNIGNAGFRGEATYRKPDNGSGYSQIVLSLDYSWPNSVYFLLEYFYNGGSLGDTNIPDEIIEARGRRFNGEIVTKNSNFVATALGYDFTPLVRFDGLVIYDVDQGGLFFGPSVNWNIIPNLDLRLGAQLSSGDAESEYGDDTDVYFTSIRVYF